MKQPAKESRIRNALESRRATGAGALVPFLTAGDPSLEATVAMVRAAADAGADVVELGVPFSDPLADGPTIQAASARALAAGTTLSGILDTVERIRARCDVPIVLMGYTNPFLAMGARRFAKHAREAGVDGVIVPDMPPEEGGELMGALREHDVDTILLVAPTTPDDRIRAIAAQSSGFLYYVSLTGVTGERDALDRRLAARVRHVKKLAGGLPLMVGFGISTGEQAAQVARDADGVVVGSAVVRRVPGRGGARGAAKRVGAFVSELRAALDAAAR